ncbi:M20/M25/M40 family metallo-hydrolase [Acetanaerobacterium sp. MSJ-12]|uniref:M42 family metallopeptidase n=1 Tax=Acetanaerobacterium sp. MSJ-12 TaxID=2841535 RepID=UPI001C0EB025|nr:M20/M25/M40 family metallo-hydrolase [Acetanaerobacterium sp. MSJ-12]
MVVLNTLKQLCALDGASGSEEQVRYFVTDRLSEMGLSYQVDALGSVIVEKKGARTPAQKRMVCAHMDEVALIVTDVDGEGYLRFDCVGGIDEKVLPGKAVRVNGLAGVIGAVPIHLQKAEEREGEIPLRQLRIDIGAASREEAAQRVQLGDIAYFDTPFTPLGEGRIAAKAIDDRAGVAILLALLKQPLQNDCTFVFTTQEEVGCRGAQAAAYTVAPDVALVLEATTAADNLGLPEGQRVCALGGGAVVGPMDRGTIYDRELLQLARRIAEERAIPIQQKQGVFGGNDAGQIHRSRGGVKTLALSVPCRNLHTASCVASAADIHAVYELAKGLIDAVD